jgi:hypothetical protein
MKKKVWNKTGISLATAHAKHKQKGKENRTCQKETQEDRQNVKKKWWVFRKEERQENVSIA